MNEMVIKIISDGDVGGNGQHNTVQSRVLAIEIVSYSNKEIVDIRLRPARCCPLVSQSEYTPRCQIRAAASQSV